MSNGLLMKNLLAHEKITRYPQPTTPGLFRMEVERINAIGNKLSDLSARAFDLRGYL